MLTDSDRKYLGNRTGPQGKRWQSVFFGLSALVLFQAAFHFFVAFKIGSASGYSLLEFLEYWSSGFRYDKLYPGHLIYAFEQLNVALAYFGLALVMAVFAGAYHQERAREQRIVEALKSAGQW